MNTHLHFTRIINDIYKFEPTKGYNSAISLLKNYDYYTFTKFEYTELLAKCIRKDLDTVFSIENIDISDYPKLDDEDIPFFSNFHTKQTSDNSFYLFNSLFSPDIEVNSPSVIKNIPFAYCFDKNELLISGETYSLKILQKYFHLFLKSASLLFVQNHHIINIIRNNATNESLNKDELLNFIEEPLLNKDYIISNLKKIFTQYEDLYDNSDDANIDAFWNNTSFFDVINKSYFSTNFHEKEFFLKIDENNLKKQLKLLYFILFFSNNISSIPQHLVSIDESSEGIIKAQLHFSEDEHQLYEFMYPENIFISIDDDEIIIKAGDDSFSFNTQKNSLQLICDSACAFILSHINKIYNEPDSFYIDKYKEAVYLLMSSISGINESYIKEIELTVEPLNQLWLNSVNIHFSLKSIDKEIFKHSQLFSKDYFAYSYFSKNINKLNAALEQSFISKNIPLENSTNHSKKRL